MTFLPLDRPATAETAPLTALWLLLKSRLPKGAPVDGDKAQRQDTLRAEARAKVDRLLG